MNDIKSMPPNDNYRKGWERLFGKKEKQRYWTEDEVQAFLAEREKIPFEDGTVDETENGDIGTIDNGKEGPHASVNGILTKVRIGDLHEVYSQSTLSQVWIQENAIKPAPPADFPFLAEYDLDDTFNDDYDDDLATYLNEY